MVYELGQTEPTHGVADYGSYKPPAGLEVRQPAGLEVRHPAGLEVVPQLPPSSRAFDQAPEPYYASAERTIFGVRRPTFFLSIALAIVIIAAAVGGGIGGSLAVQNAKSECANSISNNNSSSNVRQESVITTTVTETTTATGSPSSQGTPSPTTANLLAVPTSGLLPLDCPGLGNDITITLGVQAWVFTPICDVDYSGSDIASVIVYSFHDCLQTCASLNHYSGKDDCSSLVFNHNLTYSVPQDYGNCFLKAGKPQGYKNLFPGMLAGATLKKSSQSDR